MNTYTQDVHEALNTINIDVEKVIFSITKEGAILNANQDFCQVLMKEIHSVISSSMWDVVHEEDCSLFIQRTVEFIGVNFIPFAFRFKGVKGSSLPFYVKSCTWVSLNELLLHAIPIVNTSDYTTVEQLLVEKKITVFDIADSAAINCNFDGTVIGINDSYGKLFGWTNEELKGNKSPFVPEYLVHEFIEIKDRLVKGEKIVRLNTARLTKNGIMIPVNIIILPDYDNKGMVQGVFALSRKLEETLELKAFIEKQMANMLQHEMLLGDITNNLEVGVCQYDVKNGRFLYISPAIEGLLGIPVMDLMRDHKLVTSTCHPDDKADLFRFYKELSNELTEIEYRVLNIDGGICWIRIKITPVIDDTGNVVRNVSITQDISKQKLQDDLLRKLDMLNGVGQLSASFAHQIRNPLTAIKGFVQLLEMNTENPYKQIMTEELNKIEAITDEFLQLAKPTIGTKFTTSSIYNEINRAASVMQKEALLHNISIHLKLDDKDTFILSASNQIMQVLINLLRNSIDAMPNGGAINISTVVEENETIKISVTDTGIGIPPARLSKLGEPFYSNKEKGTGLGLMVSYKIIENHHGSIRFISKDGFGTTVEIRLPIREPNS